MWTACGGLIELCPAVVSLTLQLLWWEHGRPFSSFRPGSQKACSRIQGKIQGWRKPVLQLGGHWAPVAGSVMAQSEIRSRQERDCPRATKNCFPLLPCTQFRQDLFKFLSGTRLWPKTNTKTSEIKLYSLNLLLRIHP